MLQPVAAATLQLVAADVLPLGVGRQACESNNKLTTVLAILRINAQTQLLQSTTHLLSLVPCWQGPDPGVMASTKVARTSHSSLHPALHRRGP